MLATDHAARMKRCLLSLDGLSVGDAFGECFFEEAQRAASWIESRHIPSAIWTFTDDTAMAVSIYRCLQDRGEIDADTLAMAFAQEYAREMWRGYGGTAHHILRKIYKGTPWRRAAGEAFDGQGSCGNGAAMRAAPIGAYFADDLEAVVRNARTSAEVTHAHLDGQTGAIAVALAAAWMTMQTETSKASGPGLIRFVLDRLPHTETYERLKIALETPMTASPQAAVYQLGNGSRTIASDTVPFCLWCAARHAGNYTEALWTTVSGLGDRDTTCAIVGGIVSLSTGREGIPADWLQAREQLPI